MSAGVYEITLEQGATYTLNARFGSMLVDGDGEPVLDANGNPQIDVPRDFTGCTFRLQIRARQTVNSHLMVTVTSEDANGGIVADNDGHITVTIPDELTDLVKHDGYYDLKCYLNDSDGTEDRLLEGAVVVDRATTADAE